jgi:hypothetical protein
VAVEVVLCLLCVCGLKISPCWSQDLLLVCVLGQNVAFSGIIVLFANQNPFKK